jgi:hypothetical protein
MAKKYVEFTVVASECMGYWLAVDEYDVSLINGVGGIELEESKQHVLVWWMTGNPGDAIGIVGRQGQRTVVTVKESKIPAGSNKGAGYRKFEV